MMRSAVRCSRYAWARQAPSQYRRRAEAFLGARPRRKRRSGCGSCLQGHSPGPLLIGPVLSKSVTNPSRPGARVPPVLLSKCCTRGSEPSDGAGFPRGSMGLPASLRGGLPGSGAEAREPAGRVGLLLGHGLVLHLPHGRGLFSLSFGGDGPLLAQVAQVRVGLPWGTPPGGLDGLPPIVGEPAATGDAHGTYGLPLCPLLLAARRNCSLYSRSRAWVLGLLAGVVGASRRGLPTASRSVWLCGRPKRRKIAPAESCSWSIYMPVTAMGSLPLYMRKPSCASPCQCRRGWP